MPAPAGVAGRLEIADNCAFQSSVSVASSRRAHAQL
jgi:hypothetical protein